jgi:hypothetical protein
MSNNQRRSEKIKRIDLFFCKVGYECERASSFNGLRHLSDVLYGVKEELLCNDYVRPHLCVCQYQRLNYLTDFHETQYKSLFAKTKLAQ